MGCISTKGRSGKRWRGCVVFNESYDDEDEDDVMEDSIGKARSVSKNQNSHSISSQ